MSTRIPPRIQGDMGEFSAMVWLRSIGATVFLPIGHSPDFDMVADLDGRLVKVQVKTSTCFRKGRYDVMLATRGGNRSWTGLVKRFSPSRCDYLFAHVGDGRRWFIPASAIEAGTTLCLGGPKYAEHEVGRGAPLIPVEKRLAATLTDPRRGTEAVKREAL